MPDLEVHLYETHVGDVVGESWRDFDFVPTAEAIERFGVGSTVLSESVPLVPRQPRGKAARRRVFFDELLPEGAARQRLADRARVATTDTLGLLAAYGRDVAGAVQVIDPGAPDAADPPRARALSTPDVVDLLDDVAAFPLGNAPMTGKASLAGVQEKVLLARVADRWAQCLYGYPSTHILKPVARPHTDMIFNEEYASRIARALGLAPYATWIDSFEGTDALVIERYDRDDAVPGRRVHQEDFNQVLGASGAEKYEEHGGKVSLGRIALVVASAEGPDGLARLLTLVTLAVCVGNLDMHAKNISLLHLPDGTSRLAPAYDLVPLTHYPGIDGRMAMAINDVYDHARIRRSDLIAEAGRWGMGAVRAGEVIDAAVATIRATVQHEVPHARAVPGLADLIDSLAARIGEHAAQP
ncbi:MAG: HipA domain-containing protein [Actinomycetales bacterium]|nr:HipA domain-containing protein [Actinomycetales bacterium]